MVVRKKKVVVKADAPVGTPVAVNEKPAPDTGSYDPSRDVEPGPKVEVKGVKLEDVSMADLGFMPTGRYEAVKIGEVASGQVWRVFGPEGQKVSPVLEGKAKLSPDQNAPGEVLPPHGRAYAIAGSLNTHLMKAVGNRAFALLSKKAEAQGFPR